MIIQLNLETKMQGIKGHHNVTLQSLLEEYITLASESDNSDRATTNEVACYWGLYRGFTEEIRRIYKGREASVANQIAEAKSAMNDAIAKAVAKKDFAAVEQIVADGYESFLKDSK